MNMTSILTRALILAVFAVAVSIAVAARVERVASASQTIRINVASVSRVPEPPVELATISVRPSAQDLADAARMDDDASIATVAFDRIRSNRPQFIRTVTPTLPSLGLDMPYYSFGKAISRVSKE